MDRSLIFEKSISGGKDPIFAALIDFSTCLSVGELITVIPPTDSLSNLSQIRERALKLESESVGGINYGKQRGTLSQSQVPARPRKMAGPAWQREAKHLTGRTRDDSPLVSVGKSAIRVIISFKFRYVEVRY